MSNLKDTRAKGTPITLNDGVTRELKFTLNALAEMEDRYGSVEEAFKQLENNSIKAIRFVLWAGLLHTEEGLTEQQVGNLLDMQSLEELVGSISGAMENDMPPAEEQLPSALPNA